MLAFGPKQSFIDKLGESTFAKLQNSEFAIGENLSNAFPEYVVGRWIAENPAALASLMAAGGWVILRLPNAASSLTSAFANAAVITPQDAAAFSRNTARILASSANVAAQAACDVNSAPAYFAISLEQWDVNPGLPLAPAYLAAVNMGAATAIQGTVEGATWAGILAAIQEAVANAAALSLAQKILIGLAIAVAIAATGWAFVAAVGIVVATKALFAAIAAIIGTISFALFARPGLASQEDFSPEMAAAIESEAAKIAAEHDANPEELEALLSDTAVEISRRSSN